MQRLEPVSVVILTKDEANNAPECIDALLAQLAEGDEAIIVHSGSNDRAVALFAEHALRAPGRVRVHVFPVDVAFGEARAAGLEMARHKAVAFLSGDAVPESGWLDAMRAAIAKADVVYGRRDLAPTRSNAATVARGLRRQRFERDPDALPETFATSVNVAYRRFAFESVPLDAEQLVPDEAAYARRARLAGLRLAYAPEAIVQHRDGASLKTEWAKRLRAGAAQAMLRDVLGAPKLHLAWAAAVGSLAVAAVILANLWLLAATILAFFAPTLRRLASPASRRYRPHQLAGGAALSPVLDMAFVGSYLTRRAIRRS